MGAGVDPERVDAVLASEEYRDEVYADIEQAQAYGASGVPFFVIDKKYGVSGAQPADTFRQVLDRAWSDAHPTLEVVGARRRVRTRRLRGLSVRGVRPGGLSPAGRTRGRP